MAPKPLVKAIEIRTMSLSTVLWNWDAKVIFKCRVLNKKQCSHQSRQLLRTILNIILILGFKFQVTTVTASHPLKHVMWITVFENIKRNYCLIFFNNYIYKYYQFLPTALLTYMSVIVNSNLCPFSRTKVSPPKFDWNLCSSLDVKA